MELLRWIAGFALTIAVTGFAVFNRQDTDFYYSPFHNPASVPLCVIALGFMAAGFVAGAISMWFNTAPGRRLTRSQRRQIRALEKELSEAGQSALKDEPPSDFFPALTNMTIRKGSI